MYIKTCVIICGPFSGVKFSKIDFIIINRYINKMNHSFEICLKFKWLKTYGQVYQSSNGITLHYTIVEINVLEVEGSRIVYRLNSKWAKAVDELLDKLE